MGGSPLWCSFRAKFKRLPKSRRLRKSNFAKGQSKGAGDGAAKPPSLLILASQKEIEQWGKARVVGVAVGGQGPQRAEQVPAAGHAEGEPALVLTLEVVVGVQQRVGQTSHDLFRLRRAHTRREHGQVVEAVEAAQQRGFPAAGRPEQHGDGVGRDAQIDVAEGFRTIGLLEVEVLDNNFVHKAIDHQRWTISAKTHPSLRVG